MGRKPGSVNADHEEKRAALARAALEAWTEEGAGMSMRALARACDTSIPTLYNYFDDRDGLFEAVMEQARADGEFYLQLAANPGDKSVREALEYVLTFFSFGWREGALRRLNELGMAQGMTSNQSGQAYVQHVLEPLLVACEKMLGVFIERGDLPEQNVRFGALSLVSPVFLALMHQDSLDGSACRPLDLQEMIPAHVEAWIRGHS
jgi:AcrR family transcriptional regulator